MYFVLCADFNKTTSSILTDDSTCHAPVWQRGKQIAEDEHDLSKLIFCSETPHTQPFPDFSRNNHGCLVFSEKLTRLMTNTGCDNLDYYSAKIIEYGNSEEKHGYNAVNITRLISGVDREKSKFRERLGRIASLKSLVVDEAATNDAPIFRLEEVPRIILIHERFKKPIEDNNITGLQLIAPDEWDGFDGFR